MDDFLSYNVNNIQGPTEFFSAFTLVAITNEQLEVATYMGFLSDMKLNYRYTLYGLHFCYSTAGNMEHSEALSLNPSDSAQHSICA